METDREKFVRLSNELSDKLSAELSAEELAEGQELANEYIDCVTFEERYAANLLSTDEEMDLLFGQSMYQLDNSLPRIAEAIEFFGGECESEIAQIKALILTLHHIYESNL